MKMLGMNAAFPTAMIMAAALAVAGIRTIGAQVSVSSEATYAPDPSLSLGSTEAVTYFKFPIQKFKEEVPALNGVRYDANQEQLPSILARVAKTIAEVLPRLPDLVSREQIFHFQSAWDPSAPGGIAAAQPWNREFRFLIQTQHNADGSTTLSETRTDSKGQPIKNARGFTALRSYGFAYQWMLFSAANQPEFLFRYLGEQEKGGRKTYVVGVPGQFCTSWNETNWYGRSMGWGRRRSIALSRS